MYALDFVLPLVLAQFVPELIKRSLILTMLTDSAPPIGRFALDLGTLVGLNDLMEGLVLSTLR